MKQSEPTSDEPAAENQGARETVPPVERVAPRSTFRRHPIRWAIAGGALLLLLLGLLALSALAHLIRQPELRGGLDGTSWQYDQRMHGGFDGGPGYERQAPLSDSTFVNGVVTEVNGDSLTVAGNGTTKTVKTNGSTVYNTASGKVAVNDTVTITGVTSGDTFTATRVMVQNR